MTPNTPPQINPLSNATPNSLVMSDCILCEATCPKAKPRTIMVVV